MTFVSKRTSVPENERQEVEHLISMLLESGELPEKGWKTDSTVCEKALVMRSNSSSDGREDFVSSYVAKRVFRRLGSTDSLWLQVVRFPSSQDIATSISTLINSGQRDPRFKTLRLVAVDEEPLVNATNPCFFEESWKIFLRTGTSRRIGANVETFGIFVGYSRNGDGRPWSEMRVFAESLAAKVRKQIQY